MKIKLWLLFLVVLPLNATAQSAGIIQTSLKSMWTKSENGLVISWQRDSSVAKPSSISIFDKQGHSLLSIDILRFVPEAVGVSIWDVSARPQQLIAVAATYGRGPAVPPADVLLYFDFYGALLSAEALEPAREIDALAIDDNLNVWTLTLGAGGKDPAKTPLVIEYDKNGETVREMLPRNLFPPHESIIVANPTVGAEAAGYNAGTFWFWLPKSTDFVTIRTSDGTLLSRTQTGYPQVQGSKVIPLQIASGIPNRVIAEVRVVEEQGSKSPLKVAHFTWSADTKIWEAFDPDVCNNYRLLGTDGDQQIYFRFDTNKSYICGYSAK
jgi:hypothetical protein